jgi:hypothetical protein
MLRLDQAADVAGEVQRRSFSAPAFSGGKLVQENTGERQNRQGYRHRKCKEVDPRRHAALSELVPHHIGTCNRSLKAQQGDMAAMGVCYDWLLLNACGLGQSNCAPCIAHGRRRCECKWTNPIELGR